MIIYKKLHHLYVELFLYLSIPRIDAHIRNQKYLILSPVKNVRNPDMSNMQEAFLNHKYFPR